MVDYKQWRKFKPFRLRQGFVEAYRTQWITTHILNTRTDPYGTHAD